MHSLFRKEVMENKKAQGFGKAYLFIPRSYVFYTFVLLGVTVAFAVLLALSSYSRKETVLGVLTPDSGLIRVYASTSGEIAELKVKNGQDILANEHLLTLNSITYLDDGGSLQQQQISAISKQKSKLTKQIEDETLLSNKNQARAEEEIKELKGRIWQLKKQLDLSKKLLASRRIQYGNVKAVTQKGYVSQVQQDESYHQLLLQQNSVEEFKKELLAQQSYLQQKKFELEQLPLQLKLRLAELEKQLEGANTNLAQLRAQQSQQLKTSVAGQVTALQVNEGERVEVGQLLMHVVPKGAKLEAELYVPSRAAGFIATGQEVKLRYEAFPFQRFGIFSGKVKSVSQVILTPSQLRTPLSLTESVYPVRVVLEQQQVSAFGEQINLHSGMQLEAEIMLDSMSIIDWFLMPIYAVKGKL